MEIFKNKSADKEGAEVEAETEPLQVDNEDMPCDAVPTIFGHHNGRTSDGIECEDGIVPAQPEQKVYHFNSVIAVAYFARLNFKCSLGVHRETNNHKIGKWEKFRRCFRPLSKKKCFRPLSIKIGTKDF